ncbi:MAG: phosphodiester glycosidase family protein, partial [Bacteroidales bacterium]|nr:phosphodiester glycosidase family protein [Bacteroidales bacterium]
ALINDRKFLMITIDGRWNSAVGMTADEVTRFILHHFPTITHALNLDGGGSNCMCILGRGDASNNVVNYPTDNGTFDHLGVRSVNSHIYVTYEPPAPDEGSSGG